MTEIIPVILVKTEAEAEARIRAVEKHADWMQIDVVDGKFAPNVTWGDPLFIQRLDTSLHFEIDLMVANPEVAVRQWIAAAPKVGRIYFHYETAGNKSNTLIDLLKAAGIEAGMSLNPKTSREVLYPFAQRLDAVLFLGVEPGFSGASFQEEVIEKVRVFHQKFPRLPITVDGGVRVGTARKLAQAGAARLAASTAIFGAPDPLAALEALRKNVEGIGVKE